MAQQDLEYLPAEAWDDILARLDPAFILTRMALISVRMREISLTHLRRTGRITKVKITGAAMFAMLYPELGMSLDINGNMSISNIMPQLKQLRYHFGPTDKRIIIDFKYMPNLVDLHLSGNYKLVGYPPRGLGKITIHDRMDIKYTGIESDLPPFCYEGSGEIAASWLRQSHVPRGYIEICSLANMAVDLDYIDIGSLSYREFRFICCKFNAISSLPDFGTKKWVFIDCLRDKNMEKLVSLIDGEVEIRTVHGYIMDD